MTIGHAIQMFRQQKRMPLMSLSTASSIPIDVLADIEQDKARISDGAIVYDIATALGCSVGKLLNDSGLLCKSRGEARQVLRPYLWKLAKDRGTRLKERREYIGYSVQEAAMALGKRGSYVSDQERGTMLSIPYQALLDFSRIYDCTPGWILGNEGDQPFGPLLQDHDILLRYDPFTIYPAHIAELRDKVGLSDRQLARKACLTISELKTYYSLPRIQVPEETFRNFCLALSVSCADLRAEPKQRKESTPQRIGVFEGDSRETVCKQIISAIEVGQLSKKDFCSLLNISSAMWDQIKSGKVQLSEAAITAMKNKLQAKLV